jgi:hypothetical protein
MENNRTGPSKQIIAYKHTRKRRLGKPMTRLQEILTPPTPHGLMMMTKKPPSNANCVHVSNAIPETLNI